MGTGFERVDGKYIHMWALYSQLDHCKQQSSLPLIAS